MEREFLKSHNCQSDRQYFNMILDAYFLGHYDEAARLISLLSENEAEHFWSYANSRFIKREDSQRLSRIVFLTL